jgi:hypothetical protein
MICRAMQWAIFAVSLVLLGLSFPGMFWRADERPLLARNFGLDARDADGRPQDGVEEAFARVWQPGRLLHDLKNVGREWVEANPKLAAKSLSFVIVVLAILALL